jgi:hypothetical protein
MCRRGSQELRTGLHMEAVIQLCGDLLRLIRLEHANKADSFAAARANS